MRYSMLITLGLMLTSCVEIQPSRQTDLAIDTYRPPPDALKIAEARATKYWAKHQAALGQSTRYLAVETDSIPSADIEDLYYKLSHSPGVSDSDVADYQANFDIDIFCINIFDTRTGQLVSPVGYAVVDEPDEGSIGRFGRYTAKFIGTGG